MGWEMTLAILRISRTRQIKPTGIFSYNGFSYRPSDVAAIGVEEPQDADNRRAEGS